MATDDCHVYSYGFWGNSWASAPWAYAHPWATTQLTYPRPLPRGQGMGKGDTVALSRSPHPLFVRVLRCNYLYSDGGGKHGERARRKPLVTSRPFPFVALFPIVAPKTPNCSSFKCKTLPLHPVIVLLFFVAMVLSPTLTALIITRSLWCHRWRAQLLPLRSLTYLCCCRYRPCNRAQWSQRRQLAEMNNPYDGKGLRIIRTLIPVWRNKLRRLRIS